MNSDAWILLLIFAVFFLPEILVAIVLIACRKEISAESSKVIKTETSNEYILIPKSPPEELLISMAVRDDHGLGCPGYYDQEIFKSSGVSHKQLLESRIDTMRKIYEEVAGEGFYKSENAEQYRKLKNSGE